MTLRAALVQMCSSDTPEDNALAAKAAVARAAELGCAIALTPEVSNCVSASRAHQQNVLRHEADDPTLATLRNAAAQYGIWVLIGSLALKTTDPDGRFANRSFLIDPTGALIARYDKAHMFDADIDPETCFRESDGYRPGDTRVIARGPQGCRLGLTICYDMRFPDLYRRLAVSGADILTVPSAFTVPTGRAHWEVLLRARAIETGAFVLAPAQAGLHKTTKGRRRESWGHSLAVSPWGEVLADAGTAPGITAVDLDLAAVTAARKRIPSLNHMASLSGPHG